MPSHLSAGSRICHITTVSWPKGPGGTRRLWFRWLVSLRYFAHAHKSGSAFWHTATCGVGCVRICRVLRLSISLNHIWSEEEIQERLDNLYQQRPKSLTDKIMHRSLSNWHHQELQRWSLCKYKFRLMPFDLLCGHVYVWTKVSDLQHLCVFLCYFIHTWDDQFCWYTHQWAGYSFLPLLIGSQLARELLRSKESCGVSTGASTGWQDYLTISPSFRIFQVLLSWHCYDLFCFRWANGPGFKPVNTPAARHDFGLQNHETPSS